jgi:hypothetical protein
MMLIQITLLYVTIALAYPSSKDPTWQDKPIADLQSDEGKAVQILDQRRFHAGKGVSTKQLAVLDAIRSKAVPSLVENINSLLLSYAEVGVEGRWNTTVKHTKALLDSIVDAITQDDSQVSDSDPKINLQDLSTTFLDLLPLTMLPQAHSGAIETNSVSPKAPPTPSNGTLSANAINFLNLHAVSLSVVPVLVSLTLYMVYTTPDIPLYNTEVANYKTDLKLLLTSYLKTSKPVPFSRDQCEKGVPNILTELSRNPGAVVTYMGVATAGGLVLTIAGVLSGMIMMAYDTGIDGVLRMTHTLLREWAALVNGDASICKGIPLIEGGINSKWVNVG